MGFILDDHEMGVHAEARRETFSLYADFGEDWSVELPWSDLPELRYLVDKLVRYAKDNGKCPETWPVERYANAATVRESRR